MVDVAQSVEPRIVIPVVVGSIPIVHPLKSPCISLGPLAQLVEPRIVIPVVVGSSPIVHPTFARSQAHGLRRGKPTSQIEKVVYSTAKVAPT